MAPDSGSVPRVARPQTKRLTLHFGVLDQPYRSWTLVQGKGRRAKGTVRPITTYQVARILEDKYGIMGAFYWVKGRLIGEAVTNSLSGALESLLMGQVVDPWGSATQTIEREFRQFISSMEAESIGIPGTPTKAALRGVNHRYAHPYRRSNPRRPSFRDTGLYMASFRAVIS